MSLKTLFFTLALGATTIVASSSLRTNAAGQIYKLVTSGKSCAAAGLIAITDPTECKNANNNVNNPMTYDIIDLQMMNAKDSNMKLFDRHDEPHGCLRNCWHGTCTRLDLNARKAESTTESCSTKLKCLCKTKPTTHKFVKLPKNTNCLEGSDITEESECKEAIQDLGLKENSWWTGNHGNIPAGCTWRDYDHHNAHWNAYTSGPGKPRNDLHPICLFKTQADHSTVAANFDVAADFDCTSMSLEKIQSCASCGKLAHGLNVETRDEYFELGMKNCLGCKDYMYCMYKGIHSLVTVKSTVVGAQGDGAAAAAAAAAKAEAAAKAKAEATAIKAAKAAAAAAAAKAEAAAIKAAKVEAAKVEAARVEAAKVEAAKVEAAKVEAAKVEAAAKAKAEAAAPKNYVNRGSKHCKDMGGEKANVGKFNFVNRACTFGPSNCPKGIQSYTYYTTFADCKKVCDSRSDCVGIDHAGSASSGHGGGQQCYLTLRGKCKTGFTYSGAWRHYEVV